MTFQWLVHHFQIPHCLSCLFKLFVWVSRGMIDWIVIKIFLILSLIWTLSFIQGEIYVHYCNWKWYHCTIYWVKKRTVTGLQRVKIDKYHYWLIEYKIRKKKLNWPVVDTITLNQKLLLIMTYALFTDNSFHEPSICPNTQICPGRGL